MKNSRIRLSLLALALVPALGVATSDAQVPEPASRVETNAPVKRTPAKPPVSRRSAADDSSDELNRREAERTAKLSLPDQTPTTPAVSPVEPQTSQRPPGPAPQPVPIQPAPPAAPSTATPRLPTITTGPATRAFGQSQVVPPQQPTLRLEVSKGTVIKLPGAASTVFVAAPDIADVQVKSPTMIYIFAKKPGDTVLYAVDDQDNVLLNTIVSVTSPLSRVKGALDTMHPGNGVSFDNQGDTIVLTGTVRSALIAEDARRLALQHVTAPSKVISQIRVDAPTQVQLRVKIAEVRRDALKRIGINWQNINSIALFGMAGLRVGAAVATVSGTGGAPTAAIAVQNNEGSLTSIIDMLATQNMATILAEPSLIAMSGETASFLAGGEIPMIVPQASAGGASTILITYKQVGVALAFTPTIIGERINLKVAPEVSQLSNVGSISVPLTATAVVTIPAIQTRKASTTIELGSGQSFAIAGLLQQTSQQDVAKVPWLGDVPILGALFKSDAYQRSETELVIIITPYFVEPSSGRLRTPLSDRVPPTDADRLLYQRMDHPTPPRRVAVGQNPGQNPGSGTRASPSAGFKLE